MIKIACTQDKTDYIKVNGAATTNGPAKITKVIISSPIKVFKPDNVAAHATSRRNRLKYLCAVRIVPFCFAIPKSG